MNLPNFLTLCRIFLVPLLVAVLLRDGWHINLAGWHVANHLLALAIFLAAAGTDLVDGYLARRWGQVTTVGTLLDPIADKLLISSALIALVDVGVAPSWVVILIVGREFAVSGLRGIAAGEGYAIRASDVAKTKMLSQVVAVAMLILSMRMPHLEGPAMFVLYAVLVFSLWSAADYFWKFWRMVDDEVKARRRKELLAAERRARREQRRRRAAIL